MELFKRLNILHLHWLEMNLSMVLPSGEVYGSVLSFGYLVMYNGKVAKIYLLYFVMDRAHQFDWPTFMLTCTNVM